MFTLLEEKLAAALAVRFYCSSLIIQDRLDKEIRGILLGNMVGEGISRRVFWGDDKITPLHVTFKGALLRP